MKIKNSTFLTLFFLLSLSLNFALAQGTHKAVKLGSSSAAYGYYEYLPTNFSKNSGKFPLLIFLHGAGEKGNGKDQLNRAIKFGPGKEIEKGKHFPFVILSPQTNHWWDAKKLDDLINLAIKNYNVDPDRVYMTGLSMGAMGTYHFAASYPDRLAAMVGFAGKADNSKVCRYSHVPLWAFHGDRDPTVHVDGSKTLVAAYNKCSPAPKVKAKLSILAGYSHWGWNEMYDRSRGDIYQWMLQYSKNGKTEQQKAPVNKAPLANAGSDKSVTLPLEELYITGSAKDEDGSIKSYNWSKVSGPAVEMSGTGSHKLKLKKLNKGSYVFRLTVKDNAGATASDEMKLEVKAAVVAKKEETPNKAPVVNAGSDQSVTLPQSEVYITGSAKDEDGSVTSYNWQKVSGPGVEMSGTGSNKLKLKKLNKGSYVFRLTAKDNAGATASDEMKLQVKEAATAEKKDENPSSGVTANAGSDVTITLPVDKQNLHGSAKFVNSSARVYKWEKVKGPSVKMGGSGANLSLTQLNEGEYTFRFTVENTKGQRHSDEMKLKVQKGKKAKKGGSAPEPKPQNEPAPEETVQGLIYSYYKIDPKKPWNKLPDLRKLKPAKTGRVKNFNLSPRDQNDYFAFAFDGYIQIKDAGNYFFYTLSDEGSKLYINDKLVTNNDGVHTSQVKYNKVNLSVGSHKIRVEYFENKGGEQLYVSYKGPGVALQEVPESRLSSGEESNNGAVAKKEDPGASYTHGLNYAYYESANAHSRWSKLPDFNKLKAKKTGTVSNFSLSPAQRTNHFGLVLEGHIKIANAGDYHFFTDSDDGSQLFIDGKRVVDNDGLHAPRERSGKINLSAGYHAIKVVYYEYDGWEKLDVKWQGPGIHKQIIPASVLYRKSSSGKKQNAMVANNELAGDFISEENFEGIRLYPNPAQDYIQIQLVNTDEAAVSISIMDLSGRSLYRGDHLTNAGAAVSINLQDLNLNKGAYVLTVKGLQENGQKAFRFIKE